jgi:hypothetical protein
MHPISTIPEEPAATAMDLEVVSSESAIVQHVSTAALAATQDPAVQAQQQLISLVHAQACANAETQRNQEVRLQLAFAETEARLHSTAQALVQTHAAEQAIEVRRGMSEAIERALVDAHSKAHEQAMVVAHEQLNRLSEEIKAGVQAQLTDAVNQVHTKGGEYIERTTGERLALLKTDAIEEMDKRIQLAFVGRPQLEADTASLQVQVAQLREDIPRVVGKAHPRRSIGVGLVSRRAHRCSSREQARGSN